MAVSYMLDASTHYEWTSASAASPNTAVSVTNDADSTRPAAAASEANDPANAVVLTTSSWPLGTTRPDVSSSSSYLDAVEPVALQVTVIHDYTT